MKTVIWTLFLALALSACSSSQTRDGNEVASNDSGAKTKRVCETVRTNETGQRMKRVCRTVVVEEESEESGK